MGLARPGMFPDPTPGDPDAEGGHCRPESAPAHEAPDPADDGDATDAQVLTLPLPADTATGSDRAQLVAVAGEPPDTASTTARPRTAMVRARATRLMTVFGAVLAPILAALGGSLWRTRPAALRDIHARATRAEWAGDIEALRVAGQLYGRYIALPLVVVIYTLAGVVTWSALATRQALVALAEVVKRPTRLGVAVVFVLIPVLATAAAAAVAAAL